MIVTVSTVKDSLPNVQRWVGGNLASGVDHMVVMLDAAQPDLSAWLGDQPHVTVVEAYDDWWAGARPEGLNARQITNANVVKALLTRTSWCDWLFHVDADEVARIDRAALAGAPADVRVARLAPLEAVSRRHWEGPPTWFKRLLDDDELTLLRVLGVVERADNEAYFHGHVRGKVGIRPALDLGLMLHRVLDPTRTELEPWSAPGLDLLHYESVDGEEFVRKWTAILAAGPQVALRPTREPTAVALRTLIGKGLTPEQARPYLMRIFERTTEDDFDTLRDLDLLVEVDPAAGGHEPAPLSEGAREHLAALLTAVRGEGKEPFRPGRPPERAAKALDRLGAGPRIRGARSFLRRS